MVTSPPLKGERVLFISFDIFVIGLLSESLSSWENSQAKVNGKAPLMVCQKSPKKEEMKLLKLTMMHIYKNQRESANISERIANVAENKSLRDDPPHSAGKKDKKITGSDIDARTISSQSTGRF